MWFVYLLRCADASYYTGITNNLERRFKAHQKGTASKYTRGRRPVVLVYRERARGHSAALKREYAIKQLSHREKDRLIRKKTK